MKKAADLIKRFVLPKRQLILYLFFGFITTVCSLLACYLTLRFGVLIFHDGDGNPTAFLDILGSTVQWVVGVLIAFITSKKWVFTEAEHGARAATKQFFVFCSSRIVTYCLEVVVNLGIIALLENCFRYDAPVFSARVWAKVVSSIFVCVSNYFISKLLVFRKKNEKEEKE